MYIFVSTQISIGGSKRSGRCEHKHQKWKQVTTMYIQVQQYMLYMNTNLYEYIHIYTHIYIYISYIYMNIDTFNSMDVNICRWKRTPSMS